MPRDFSIRECFAVGWARFQERPWFLIGVSLFTWVVAFVSTFLVEEIYGQIEPTRSILDFFSSLLYYWICFGMMVMTLKMLDGQSVTWGDLFVFDRRFLFYIVATILYFFMVGIGLLFLIIPGIYLMLRYSFFWYAIIDGHKGVFDSFSESAAITQGVKWQLILFVLTTIGVMFLGLLFLGIGVLVATPVTMLASAHLYRVLLKQSQTVSTTDATLPETPVRPEQETEVTPSPIVDETIPPLAK